MYEYEFESNTNELSTISFYIHFSSQPHFLLLSGLFLGYFICGVLNIHLVKYFTNKWIPTNKSPAQPAYPFAPQHTSAVFS